MTVVVVQEGGDGNGGGYGGVYTKSASSHYFQLIELFQLKNSRDKI